jgi:hypothetical protein
MAWVRRSCTCNRATEAETHLRAGTPAATNAESDAALAQRLQAEAFGGEGGGGAVGSASQASDADAALACVSASVAWIIKIRCTGVASDDTMEPGPSSEITPHVGDVRLLQGSAASRAERWLGRSRSRSRSRIGYHDSRGGARPSPSSRAAPPCLVFCAPGAGGADCLPGPTFHRPAHHHLRLALRACRSWELILAKRHTQGPLVFRFKVTGDHIASAGQETMVHSDAFGVVRCRLPPIIIPG